MKKLFLNPEIVLKAIGIMKGMIIADFGCGAGAWVEKAALLVGKSGKIYGLDILDHMLEVTRSRVKRHNLHNVRLIKTDIEDFQDIKIKKHSCDLVIFSNILFQVKDKVNAIKNAQSLIKKKGKILIVDWLEDAVFGPDKKLRIKKSDIIKLMKNNNFVLDKEVDTGFSHYGLLFKLENA